MMEERRKSLRIKMATMAQVTPHGLQTAIDIMVRDLSTGGMGGYADRPFRPGTLLLLKITLKTEDNSVIAERLQAKIAWTTKIDGDGKYAFGAEFLNMEKNNPRLYAYLKDMEKVSASVPA